MKEDELDHILSQGEDIVPSSGFVPAVMDAVLREASAPPPIPFPWKLAVPSLAAFVVGFTLFVALAWRDPASDAAPLIPVLLETASSFEAGWLALALLMSFASVVLPMRLLRGRT